MRLAATECLQEEFPDETVGELSVLRSALTSDRTLAELAERIGLNSYLQVSDPARADTLGQPARLADALEAVLAALYLETHDLSLIRPWLDARLLKQTDAIEQDPTRQNHKLKLQELTQAHAKALPTYRTEEQRPIDGDPNRFRADVWFQEICWGTGHGPTKKRAEQAAAAMAYPALKGYLRSASGT